MKKKIVISIYSCLFIIFSFFNIQCKTESITSKIKKEPLETNPFTIEKEFVNEYYKKWEKHGYFVIFGSYPRITGFSDVELEKQVNAWIKETNQASIELFKNSFEVTTNALGKDTIESGIRIPWHYYFAFKILTLNPQLISLLMITNCCDDGVRSYNKYFTINIDLLKRKQLENKDLFIEDSNSWEKIKPLFAKQVIDQYNNLYHSQNISSTYFDPFKREELLPYLHFGFSPSDFIISFDQTHLFGLNTQFITKIPYSQIQDVLLYSEFNEAFSDISGNGDWEVIEHTFDFELEKSFGFSIKVPKSFVINKNLEFFENQLKINIPSEKNDCNIQILWKKTENDNENKPFVDTSQGSSNSLKMDSILFTKKQISKTTDQLQGRYGDVEYTILIQIPTTDEELMKTVNQILGTFRIY